MANVIVREERLEERPMSNDIVRLAYGRENEVRLTDAIRGAAEYIPDLSIVADLDGSLLGYALFAGVGVLSQQGMERALVLAVLAVHPMHQREGVGERLVRHGLERCRTKGLELVFVNGLPAFFSRVGFQPAKQYGFEPGIPVSDEDFQTIDLSGVKLGVIKGVLQYPSVFEGSTPA